jgi:CRISPR-associated endonuclease/helicase Cas3
MFFAHSENPQGIKHELVDHLERSGNLARSFAPVQDYGELFYLAGILHDVGKFQDEFQKYLKDGRPRTPHAGIGAYVASTLGKHLLPLQFVIKGHHTGLPDNDERKTNNAEYAEEQELVSIVRGRMSEACFSSLGNMTTLTLPKDMLVTECLTRFIFSAVTDADWLDTESHFRRDRSDERVSKVLNPEPLIHALEKEFSRLQCGGPINALRTKARIEAVASANSPTGFFSLQLPTGLGKTLISSYWALLHARYHGLKRIIIVLPYLSIIDQTASILKHLFGEDVVLEHHSGIVEEDLTYQVEEVPQRMDSSSRLACENWDAPFIVTTSVQFFESLFSDKPSKCRKNHNIAESMVIFDEIQTLPKHLAEPTIVMLKNIALLARTSFLFCTATQPAFAKREGFDGLDQIQPLIQKPEGYFKATRRVNFTLLRRLQPISLDDLLQELSLQTESFLAILNTKTAARGLYERVHDLSQFAKHYHLSTAMCPCHRKRVIEEIVAALKNQEKIAVVSTQLVEAGVDLDFPRLYRAIAPMDAVIQSAGRCNRNGSLKKKGTVVLFNLKNERWPDQTYRTCAHWTMGKIRDRVSDLHRAETFGQYFKEVTSLFVNPDRFNITEERKAFNFQSVARKYRIVDQPTVALIIARYSHESEMLLNELKQKMEHPGNTKRVRDLLRQMQQYTVQVYRQFLEKHKVQPYKDSLYIWYGNYDLKTGLWPEKTDTVF